MIRFAWLDYLASLRERKVWLAIAILVYAVLTLPVLFARPPPHVSEAMTTWFGTQDPFVLFMYIWIDLAMNKVIGILPVIVGGGIVLRERDTQVLPVLAAKPLSLQRYFVVRTLSACAVMATLYVGAQCVGALYFTWQIQGFRAGTFFAVMSLHVWAAIFATALAATLAVWVGRRALGALVAILVLSMLVGMALIGFYNPAWSGFALVNPISISVQPLGNLDALGPADILVPMLVLLVLSGVTIALGALAVRRMEA
jgi:ABC-2 type transport system permease protein